MGDNRKGHLLRGMGIPQTTVMDTARFVLVMGVSLWLCVHAGAEQSPSDLQQQRRRELAGSAAKRAEERQSRSPRQEAESEGIMDGRRSFEERLRRMREESFERLQKVLNATDKEWQVIRPRLRTVFDLVSPEKTMGPNLEPRTDVDVKKQALRKILQDEKAETQQIKDCLTALRAAQENARQERLRAQKSLREILSVRQEAELALQGLLD